MGLYNKLTTETFIIKANQKHNNKYDYTLSNYINSSTKLNIRCTKHNTIFSMTPNNHLRGQGCYECSIDYKKLLFTKPIEQLLEDFINKHGNKYGYHKVADTYINGKTHVNIYCNKHQKYFKQKPEKHLAGDGCPDCGNDTISIKSMKPLNELLYELKVIYGDDKFDYSAVVYTAIYHKRKPMSIIISRHGFKNYFRYLHFLIDKKLFLY